MYILTRHNHVIDYCSGGYLCMGCYVICQDKNKTFYDCMIVDIGNKPIPDDLLINDYLYIEGNFTLVGPKAVTSVNGNAPDENGNISLATYTHPNSGVTAGTYKSVTVNAQGHVTGGSNPTTLAGHGITDAPTKTGTGASGTWGISVSGNAATATKLATARTINIQDSSATNTGTGASFNGSGNATIKLPATIKANITGNCSGSSGSCTGNSATATKATQDSAGQQINTTYIKGLSISGNTITYTKGNGGTGTLAVPTGAGAGAYIVEKAVNSDGSWYRKYSDGWIEQGGKTANTANYFKVTLLKAFTTTSYIVTFGGTSKSTSWGPEHNKMPLVYTRTTTSFTMRGCFEGSNNGAFWMACGK